MLLGAEVRGETIPNGAGSCDELDCTKVSSRKNISAVALLFYRKFRYDSRRGAQAPRVETDEFGTVLFCFSISLSKAGLNEVRVQLLQGRHPGSIP